MILGLLGPLALLVLLALLELPVLPVLLVDSANIEPIDKSMQFMIISTPTPMVAMPIQEICFSILIILLALKKFGANMDKYKNIMTNPMTIP